MSDGVVLRDLSTEDALELLSKHGVIRHLTKRGGGNTGTLPGYSFYNTATGEKYDGPTQSIRRYALGLQHNLNIVLERNKPIRTEAGPRVFFPGDELPIGVTVMGRDRSVGTVQHAGMKVKKDQPDPLIELVLPDYEALVREAWVRREARRERDA